METILSPVYLRVRILLVVALGIFFASPQLADARVPKKPCLYLVNLPPPVSLGGQLRPTHSNYHQFAHHTARIHNSLIVVSEFVNFSR